MFSVARELGISMDHIESCLKENGYGSALKGKGLDTALTEPEVNQALLGRSKSDRVTTSRVDTFRKKRREREAEFAKTRSEEEEAAPIWLAVAPSTKRSTPPQSIIRNPVTRRPAPTAPKPPVAKQPIEKPQRAALEPSAEVPRVQAPTTMVKAVPPEPVASPHSAKMPMTEPEAYQARAGRYKGDRPTASQVDTLPKERMRLEAELSAVRPTNDRHEVDFLVIGSGVAGLWFALHVADHGSVVIVTKKERAESNTNYAQGGIAAVLSASDSCESHLQDTLIAGAGLSDPQVTRIVVTEGPGQVRALMDKGASFTRSGGALHMGREGGHSAARIVHAQDATGWEVERALLAAIHDHPNIRVLEYHFAVDLITQHHLGQVVTRLRPDVSCFGAYVCEEPTGMVHTFLAKVTMLATGGSGAVYLHTTNPPIATGDGVAMAYRAKARIANMEFVQFHPTALYRGLAARRGGGQAFLVSEALRGHGAVLVNQAGSRFMLEYDARAELASRDIVARAIDDQLKQRGDDCVFLDISHRPREEVERHFPNIAAACRKEGFDLAAEPVPVVPCAHYQCGGVVADHFARTSITGLMAAGETACSGLHGANRLASNSLLEALVFSRRAASAAIELAKNRQICQLVPDWDASGTQQPQEQVLLSHNLDALQRVMWDYVGIVRTTFRLERALRRTRLLYEEVEAFYRQTRLTSALCELRNMIAVSYLIIRSAQMRRESRGLHYTLDYPDTVDAECRPTYM